MEDKIEKFLLNIVDVAWNECTETKEVPSTDWAKKIIEKANVDNIDLSNCCSHCGGKIKK